MLGFIAAAAVLLLLTFVLLLRPLLKSGPAAGAPDRRGVNLDILRDQFAELETDLKSGAVSPEQYERSKAELERRALEEAEADAGPAAPPVRSGRAAAVALALGIPAAAIALYLHLGAPSGLQATPRAGTDPASVSPQQFEQMTDKLARRLKDHPDDFEGWVMLGRAYKVLQHFAESAQAFAHAVQIKPEDPAVLAEYAEALALRAGGSFQGEPTTLLAKALKIDPNNQKALALAGGAAFERADYKEAVRVWGNLLRQTQGDPRMKAALEAGIAQARAKMGEAGLAAATRSAAVTGTVSLAFSLAAHAAPEDVVFVFARAAQGPRMPLAVKRLRVRDLPYEFRLDDADAMNPNLKLSDFKDVVIVARVSKSGSAQAASGDLEGTSATVKPGARGVRVVIDRLLP
ncbi:MAG TPA: c-type cytochrome biogenesis protein CcmI [Burkholderiales bacterium]|nr:c-type cytochrome biogenesis protein CcmI [Burkholderiales bacterium]